MRWLSQGEALVPTDDLSWLSATERQRLAGMTYTKRRAEYLLGRWTAKLAVAAVEGLPTAPSSLAALEVRPAADGAPVAWLDGQALPRRVSLTDRAGWAVCGVSPSGLEVGCDLELVEHRSPGFVADYFTSAEQTLAHAAPSEREWQRRDQPHLVGEGERAQGAAHGAAPRHPFGRGDARGGRRRRLGSADRAERRGLDVLRLVAAVRHVHLDLAAPEPLAPPIALDEPPALANAIPLHSWLAHPRW